MSESTMRYDPENDIFFHKHEDSELERLLL